MIRINLLHNDPARVALEKQRTSRRKSTAKWRAADPEAALKRGREEQRLWRERHPGAWEADLAERGAAWAKAHPEYKAAKFKRWQAKNVDHRRAYMREWHYGVTQLDYDRMMTEQNETCALCKGPPVGKPFLVVDHNHETGKVRGLLCQTCNTGLGKFGDNVDQLRAAVDYLTRNN